MRRSLILLLTLGVAGCATMPGGSEPAAAGRSTAPVASDQVTQAQIGQLQRQAAMAEAEIKLLRRQLAALAVELERLAVEPAPSSAALSVPPRLGDAPPIRPHVDEIETSDLAPIRVEPQAVEPAPAEPAEAERLLASAPAPSQMTAAVPASGQAIYDRGYTLYHQGRFVDAESSFQRFLQAHGNTELADNAQFWIGESRFARGDHMGALLAFQEVLDVYPDGNKVADAMLKAGDCLVHLDNREAGLQRYEEVLRRFPGSAAAAMAEERLNRPGD